MVWARLTAVGDFGGPGAPQNNIARAVRSLYSSNFAQINSIQAYIQLNLLLPVLIWRLCTRTPCWRCTDSQTASPAPCSRTCIGPVDATNAAAARSLFSRLARGDREQALAGHQFTVVCTMPTRCVRNRLMTSNTTSLPSSAARHTQYGFRPNESCIVITVLHTD